MTHHPAAKGPWIVDFVLLAAIWGASFLFARMGAVEFGALPTAGLRVLIAAAVLMPLLLMRGLGPTLTRHWKLTFVVGVVNSAIPFACIAFALLYISTGLGAILNATVPLFGALVAWVWLGDKPGRSRILGLALGFTGILMLAWDKASFKSTDGGLAPGWAVLASLLACLCYGIAASLTRRYMQGMHSLVSATGSQIGASLALLPFTVIFWPTHSASLTAWASVAALGVFCTGIAYILYFRLIERAGPARALAVTFGIPVFANFYGVLLLGEVITPWMLVCALIIVLGTMLSAGLVKLGKK